MRKTILTLCLLCMALLNAEAVTERGGLWLKPGMKTDTAAWKDSPFQLRLLNHWDNPDGTIERGYAGKSIFWKADGKADLEVVRTYAVHCASVGINGVVLNNVNAKPLMLTAAKLKETKRIAEVLGEYGIKTYLSVNFASPKALGDLTTADPCNDKVKAWWRKKAKEIYKLMPDFGGFLVKANSEGEPGPMDYGRTHADGANMLADALKPYGGIVMWRAFVYSATGGDRASQAWEEFVKYDGRFRDNVIIQIKNGPVDFQPREPLSPLFFALKHTKMMLEVQVTQEYTGESIHTCFLPFYDVVSLVNTKYRTTLANPGLKVDNLVGIAGVANVGDSPDWCGSVMAQANWYGFGRMASDPTVSKEKIAREWLSLTFTTQPEFLQPMTRVLMQSHEAVVKYMMPLGLHHIFAGGHHYGPEPWCDPQGWREDWKPRYYHKADRNGIGFDRTDRGGSGNTRLYPDTLYNIYNDPERCPEQLLLWFHHLPWTHRLHSGETLWDGMCHRYDEGVREAEAFAEVWRQMKPYVDAEVHERQQRLFDRQAQDAWWWRDACLLYFQQFSGMPLPLGSPEPRHTLKQLMDFHLDMDNYSTADITKLP